MKLSRLVAFGFLAFVPFASLAQEFGGACEEIVARSPDFQDLSRIYTAVLANPSLHCSHATLNSCAGEQLDTHWHYRAVDADLMRNEMDAWRAAGKSGGREPIAIVDGLFGPHIEGLLKNRPAVESRTTFGSELSGHGSQTAQLSSGPEGLGIAPENPLTVYDVAHPDSSLGKQFVDTQDAYKAARDACAAGSRVINMSLNENKHGRNAATAAEELSDLVGDLANQGCVLVKAAGNDGIQDSETLAQYVTDFQIYLSAGATRKSGGVAAFSDEGSVYAPGQGIAVTLPPSQLITCGTPRTEAVLGGTSFAAPIITGITSQVLEVLKTSPKFRALAPLEQTRTVVRTVRNSAAAPTANVNALKAVKGAMAWVAENGGPAMPPVPKGCGIIPPSCVRPSLDTDCAAESRCSSVIRTALAICPDRLAKQPVEAFLGASALDPWLGLQMVDTLAQGPGKKFSGVLAKLVAKNYSDEFWQRELLQQKAPFEGLDHFVDLFVRTRLHERRRPNQTDAQVMGRVLQIWGTGNRTAQGFWNNLLKRPDLATFTTEAARLALLDKRTVREGGAVRLMQTLNEAYGGSAEMGALALDFTKNFPAYERPFLLQHVAALTMGPKRLPNTSAVVDSLVTVAATMDPATKIRLRNFLAELGGRNRASEEEIARWQSALK